MQRRDADEALHLLAQANLVLVRRSFIGQFSTRCLVHPLWLWLSYFRFACSFCTQVLLSAHVFASGEKLDTWSDALMSAFLILVRASLAVLAASSLCLTACLLRSCVLAMIIAR
jgi:hypothetical protein